MAPSVCEDETTGLVSRDARFEQACATCDAANRDVRNVRESGVPGNGSRDLAHEIDDHSGEENASRACLAERLRREHSSPTVIRKVRI
jgi:hypothetical protein